MRRNLKKFLKQKSTFIICIFFLLLFTFMANGYGILKTRLDITGASSIFPKPDEELWNPRVDFVMTSNIGNMFFYDIIIYNDNKQTYEDWKIKIYDLDYITYPYSIDGERVEDGWLLNNSNWDNRLEGGENVTVTITFFVNDDSPNGMTISEYAKYFVENFITVSGTNKKIDREGTVITNGNAKLMLEQSEEEISTFDIKRNLEYESSTPNEKQYIINIYNNTNKTYFRIRGDIYLGSTNKMLEVSPSEITCVHDTNTTFVLPTWLEIPKNSVTPIYIMITAEDEDFIPDIVLATKK